jgi:hypothetical protein
MRYLVLILLTLSVSCGEEVSKPVKRKEKEEESQDSDMGVGLDESLVGGSDGDRDAGCCIRVGSEVFEQIEVTYDRPELGLYRDTFVKPSLSHLDRDSGLGLD